MNDYLDTPKAVVTSITTGSVDSSTQDAYECTLADIRAATDALKKENALLSEQSERYRIVALKQDAETATMRQQLATQEQAIQERGLALADAHADNARLREGLRIIDVARQDDLRERPDAYELWELQLTREESAKVRAALSSHAGNFGPLNSLGVEARGIARAALAEGGNET